ncbi:hypothetical protein N0V92_009316 [Colletotrichum tropicale]|nr:hypothetical protein N0V92_009316 [Colletotrichum tropicale]
MADSTQQDVIPSWGFLEPNPQTSVTIQCGGKSFLFNKAILTQHSEYFAACLNNTTFIESQTSTITFDDIEPEHLDVYLHFLYCMSVDKDLLQASIKAVSKRKALAFLVKTWQISDRFLSRSLCSELERRILKLGPDQKPNMDCKTEERRVWWLNNLKGAFEAWDNNVANQVDIRDRMVLRFVEEFPLKHFRSTLTLIGPNSEFMCELLKAMCSRATNLEERVAELENEIEEMEDD